MLNIRVYVANTHIDSYYSLEVDSWLAQKFQFDYDSTAPTVDNFEDVEKMKEKIATGIKKSICCIVPIVHANPEDKWIQYQIDTAYEASVPIIMTLNDIKTELPNNIKEKASEIIPYDKGEIIKSVYKILG